jgi:ribonuclease-3
MVAPSDPFRRLVGALGWAFVDPSHLEAAMVHRSYCAEHPEAASNERLEFLGDAVLGLAVTDHVYATYRDLPEGELAKLRASVVNAEVLAEIAVAVGIGPALALGKGEDASGGREKGSILADAMEAVIAAVYLDGGWDAARSLVLRLLGERIEEGAEGPGGSDFKTRLQEFSTREFDQLPRYQVKAEGPDHSKRFFATVTIRATQYGEGQGRSKKQAEQAAARGAWFALVGAADSALVGLTADGLIEDDLVEADLVEDDLVEADGLIEGDAGAA